MTNSSNNIPQSQMANSSNNIPQDGFDTPVYGLHTYRFYLLHILAVVFMTASLVCATVSLVMSFRRHRRQPFFSWTTCDRFIIHEAVFDGPLILPRAADHMQMLITEDHVYPKTLCQFYGFMTASTAASQHIFVGIIAINVFAMMYFRKKLEFGKYDWILFVVIYGIPLAGGIVAWSLGSIGPNGAICLFDGVRGRQIFSLFYTVPLLVILTVNTILYLLTWFKIKAEVRKIASTLGQDPPSRKAARQAAESMSLLVAAFLIQWWSPGLYGGLELFGRGPDALLHTCGIFGNSGGILNLGVYALINRKRFARSHHDSSSA